MRELKFRAFNQRTREMEYIEDLYWFEENYVNKNGDNDFIIIQFTGLKDSNGQDIYEGDVLHYIHNTGGIDVVKNINGCFCLCEIDKENTESPFCQLDTMEANSIKWLPDYVVIGDIYENPELLKDKK